jgi:hypothetical protein
MKRVISIIAIVWAFFCTVLILVVVINGPQLAQASAKLPFMKINPLFTGGELNYTVTKHSLVIAINKPVFEALIGKSKTGFVQVKFSGSRKALQLIEQEIDYDLDTKADFRLKINTLKNKTEFISLNPNVISVIVSSKVKNNWIVRIKVINNENK